MSLSKKQSWRRYLEGQRHVAGERGGGTGVGGRKDICSSAIYQERMIVGLLPGPVSLLKHLAGSVPQSPQ